MLERNIMMTTWLTSLLITVASTCNPNIDKCVFRQTAASVFAFTSVALLLYLLVKVNEPNPSQPLGYSGGDGGGGGGANSSLEYCARLARAISRFVPGNCDPESYRDNDDNNGNPPGTAIALSTDQTKKSNDGFNNMKEILHTLRLLSKMEEIVTENAVARVLGSMLTNSKLFHFDPKEVKGLKEHNHDTDPTITV